MKPKCPALVALAAAVAGCSAMHGSTSINQSKAALSAAQVETIAYAHQMALKYSRNGSDACYRYSIENDETFSVAVASDVEIVEGAIVQTCGPSFYIIRNGNGPYLEVPMR